jgi:hypothetical protein
VVGGTGDRGGEGTRTGMAQALMPGVSNQDQIHRCSQSLTGAVRRVRSTCYLPLVAIVCSAARRTSRIGRRGLRGAWHRP